MYSPCRLKASRTKKAKRDDVYVSNECFKNKALPGETSVRADLGELHSSMKIWGKYYLWFHAPQGVGWQRRCKTRHPLRKLGNKVTDFLRICVFCGNHDDGWPRSYCAGCDEFNSAQRWWSYYVVFKWWDTHEVVCKPWLSLEVAIPENPPTVCRFSSKCKINK